MKVLAVFKDNCDYTRTVTDFLRDFEYQTGHTIETVDPDALDGEQFCDTYGIVQYPTIIAISDDGVMQNTWSSLPLPTINEITYYAQQN